MVSSSSNSSFGCKCFKFHGAIMLVAMVLSLMALHLVAESARLDTDLLRNQRPPRQQARVQRQQSSVFEGSPYEQFAVNLIEDLISQRQNLSQLRQMKPTLRFGRRSDPDWSTMSPERLEELEGRTEAPFELEDESK